MFARAQSLTVRHIGRKRPALRSLDLEWEEGERLLVLGPSGAGKSTLALCLDGLGILALRSHTIKSGDDFWRKVDSHDPGGGVGPGLRFSVK